jgi:hypothetical protein
MPRSPEECREHARRCAEFAHTAATAELKQTLTALSQNWLDLAVELERTPTLGDGQPTSALRFPSMWNAERDES